MIKNIAANVNYIKKQLFRLGVDFLSLKCRNMLNIYTHYEILHLSFLPRVYRKAAPVHIVGLYSALQTKGRSSGANLRASS